MSTPDWLTEAYMTQALRTHHKDENLGIIELQLHTAMGKGENFGGILTRAKVKYQLSHEQEILEKSLMIKTSYEDNEFALKLMQPYDIFNREMCIYENVLPKLTKLLRDINDSDNLFAKALHVDYVRQAIIFEDLSARGYIMADRITRLDLPHVELVLRKLAKMHATSAVLNERESGSLETYDRGFFNRYTNNYSPYFVGGLIACGEHVSKWPEYAKYGKKLLALAPHYMEIGKCCFAPTPSHINVLTHGDVWTTNIMFKYDIGTKAPIDVLLIDFQYTFWGSPTLDLHHFFNTSLKEPLRCSEQDYLFMFYHRIFIETLRKLSYQRHALPSLKLFRQQAEEKRFFALHSTCVVQPVMINEDTRDADFNALMGEDERAVNFKKRLYNNKIVQQNLKNLLPIYDRRGLLEINQCN